MITILIENLNTLSKHLERLPLEPAVDVRNLKQEINEFSEDMESFKQRINELEERLRENEETALLNSLILIRTSLLDMSTGFSNLADECERIIIHDDWSE